MDEKTHNLSPGNSTQAQKAQGVQNTTLEFLLIHELQQAFHAWDASQPPRDGLHASSVLEPDTEFCVRQHVLADSFPGERQTREQYLPALQKFLHGWQIHEKWQHDLLKPTGLVIKGEYTGLLELDLTHIDADTGIKYSPDAIINFAGLTLPIEIKGINHEDYAGCEELYRKSLVQVADRQYGVTYEKAQEARPGIVGASLSEAMERNKSIRSAVPQLNLYMHLLGLTTPPNNRGVVLVEDKDKQNFTLFVHTYDPALVEKPLDHAGDVKDANQEYYDLGILPTRICHARTDARAKRCPFADACFKRSNGGGE